MSNHTRLYSNVKRASIKDVESLYTAITEDGTISLLSDVNGLTVICHGEESVDERSNTVRFMFLNLRKRNIFNLLELA